MKLLLLLFPLIAISAGRIQNSDVKSEAEILAAGGTKAQLINDSKIYLGGAINKRLDEAITDGDIGGGSSPVPLTKGQLITHDGTTYVAANACGNKQIIEWDSTQTYGFKCVDKPLELKYVQRLTTIGNQTWVRSSPNVRRVVFYYCGGGGAGGGADTTTTTVTKSYGYGGFSGQLRKCTIDNPASGYLATIGSGGTGVAGASGNAGGNTGISPCTSATGGAGGINVAGASTFPDTTTNDFSDTFNCGYGNTTATDFNNYSITTCEGQPPFITAEWAISGGGGFIPYIGIPELARASAPRRFTNATGQASLANSCGGGGGALNIINQTTARAGGAGGSGQIVSYEYE